MSAPPALPPASSVAPSPAFSSSGGASSSSSSGARLPPPPFQLVGHENLFNYFKLSKWSKAHLKAPLSAYYDGILRDAGLPLVAGPVGVDGAPVERDVNAALMTFAFQAPPGPLQPRELSARTRAQVLSLSSAPSKNNPQAGPLGSLPRLTALVDGRGMMLAQEEKHHRREKKRQKEERARMEAAAAAAAAVQAAPLTTAESKPTLPVGGPAAGVGKKRKADDATAGDAIDEKKKKKKVKEELVV